MKRRMMVRYLIPLAVLGLASCTRTEPQDTAASPGALDGPYESYHPNGQLWSRGSYSNGFLSGPYEEYYENGQLWTKGSWAAGLLDGPFERYSASGELEARGSYTRGEQCGEWTEDGGSVSYPPCPHG